MLMRSSSHVALSTHIPSGHRAAASVTAWSGTFAQTCFRRGHAAAQSLPDCSSLVQQQPHPNGQQDYFRPAQPKLGSLLLQQPLLPPPPQQVRVMLLQQPVPPAHLWPPARPQQQQQPQPQLCQRALQPMPPSVLTAEDGFMLSRRERYMAPEAATLQGHTLPDITLKDLTDFQAAAAAAAQTVAAAAQTVATAQEPPTLQEPLQTLTKTASQPQLVVAAQACVLERPATVDSQATINTNQQQQQKQPRRRRRTSTSSGSGSVPIEPSAAPDRGSSSSSSTSSSNRSRRRSRRSTTSSAGLSSSPAPATKIAGAPSNNGSGSSSGSSSLTAQTQVDVVTGVPDSSSAAAHSSSTPSVQASRMATTDNSGTPPSTTTTSTGRSSCSSSRTTSSYSSTTPSSSSSMRPHHHSPPGAESDDAELSVLLQLQEALLQRGIELSELRYGQHHPVCPECQGGSQSEDCFALTLNEDGSALWCCHRATCGHTGGLTVPVHSSSSTRGGSSGSHYCSSSSSRWEDGDEQGRQAQPASPPVTALPPVQLQQLSPEWLSWFQQRGISPTVLARNRVGMERRYVAPLQTELDCVAFPFFQAGQLVNVKYRAMRKHFSQVKGGQQVFYGIDDLQGAREAFIVEGEMDKLAIESATGCTSVLSLPSGAVPAPKPGQPFERLTHSKKLACVDQAAQQLSQLQHCIIAVDGDAPGWATAMALAWRISQLPTAQSAGGPTVHYLPWPSASVGGAAALRHVAAIAAAEGLHVDLAAAATCKDANDVLVMCGARFLELYLQAVPKPWSLSPSDFVTQAPC